jgi:hypothetical protein
MPTVPASLALALAFFSFRLAHPDNAFFAQWSPPETMCPSATPAVGVLEVLAPCSGMPVLLTPKRVVFVFTSDRFRTAGSSVFG